MSSQFYYYPEAKELQQPDAKNPPQVGGSNPVLRGLPLAIASQLVYRSGYLQKFLWWNAGFGNLGHVPGLAETSACFRPGVIPVRKTDEPKILEFGENHISAQVKENIHDSSDTSRKVKPKFLTVADYHYLYTQKSITPLQVATELLRLTNRKSTEKDQYWLAWVDYHGQEEAVLESARQSTERFANGTAKGILDGVPFGVKDDIDVKGFVSHAGVKCDPNIPYQRPATHTAGSIQHLLDAGAIMIGKMSMHEIGCDTTGCNPAWGTPINWCNPAYYTGGSSSGAASALCAGLVPIAVGTDAGGSARIPPAFTGVYGLKVSHHRLGNLGHTMVSICPMASSVADLTIAYRTMAQPHSGDTVQNLFSTSIPPSIHETKTVGIDKAWIHEAEDSVATTCLDAIQYLASNGYNVVDVVIPNRREAQLAHGMTCLTELGQKYLDQFTDGSNALTHVNSATRIVICMGSQTPAKDYLRYQQIRLLMMQHMAYLFERHENLLIVTPTSPFPGWIRNPSDDAYGLSDGDKSLASMKFAFLANTTGCPAISVPIGTVDPEVGEGRIPVGLMAMAEWGKEEYLLSWARDLGRYYVQSPPKAWLDVVKACQRPVN